MIFYLLFFYLLSESMATNCTNDSTSYNVSIKIMCLYHGNLNNDSDRSSITVDVKNIPCECDAIVYSSFHINKSSMIDVDEQLLKSVTDLNKPVIVELRRTEEYSGWSAILGENGYANETNMLCDFAKNHNIQGYDILFLEPFPLIQFLPEITNKRKSLKGASIIRGQNSSTLLTIPEKNNNLSNNEIIEQISPLHLTNTSFSQTSSPEYLNQTIDEGTVEIINRPKTVYKLNYDNNKDPTNNIEDTNNNFATSPATHIADGINEISPKILRSNSNEFSENVSVLRCPLCKSGNLPSVNDGHKCMICSVSVHAIPSCSTQRKGNKDLRLCLACSKDVLEELEENKSVETWNRTSKKQRNSKSYLCPNPNLRHLQLKSSKHIQSLPILKNGSRAQELKSCTIKNLGKVIMSNTCDFDTVSAILMVSINDRDEYKVKVDECNNEFLKFTAELITNGLTSRTYSKRAEIMIKKLNPELEILGYNTTLAKCETVASNIFNCALAELPSAYDYIECNINNCGRTNEGPIPINIITYTTNNDGLYGLQSYLSSRVNIEKMRCGYINDSEPCEGLKTKTTTISEYHLFVEILNWEGDEKGNFSSEAVPQLQIALKDIPEILINSEKTYELRGVGCYRRSPNSLRTSTGHYYACCKRGINNWELFDDLLKNVKQVKSTTVIPCEFLIYTI